MNTDSIRLKLVAAILAERRRGERKFGPEHNRPNGYWLGIVTEEMGEAAKAYTDLETHDRKRWIESEQRFRRPEEDDPALIGDLLMEIVQTAATCVGWAERLCATHGTNELEKILAKLGVEE